MEERKGAIVRIPALTHKRVEPTDDMLFGTRGFWLEVCKLQLKPGARPWMIARGNEYFSSADVIGFEAKKSRAAATLKHVEGLLARGFATKLEGWGWAVRTSTLDDLLDEGLDGALEEMGRLYGGRAVASVHDEIAAGAYERAFKQADPSIARDLAHKPVPLPARTPFNHFPDLEGWIVESFDGKSTGIAEL